MNAVQNLAEQLALLLNEKPDWVDALDDIHAEFGAYGVREVIRFVQERALELGVPLNDAVLNTPYVNTIPPLEQPPYPGDLELERRIGARAGLTRKAFGPGDIGALSRSCIDCAA